jgi:ferritin-like metal-binding protein YciE
MPIVTLRDLYIAELQDLLDAEQQSLQELPALAESATSSALRDALGQQMDQTRVHAERVELLLRQLGPSRDGRRCDAMYGLIQEGRRRVAETERGEVLDAALIGFAQRIEHYEIAVYGCARTYALTLGDRDAANLLQQTLDEEGAADARLTQIAERGINASAGEGEQETTRDGPLRLRYVPATHLREFKYREFRVRNAAAEDLGSLDGLIIDTRSDRPEYFVIDSGGWFVGRRFLVPIDALRPDEATRTLRTDLDRSTIESYPPFNADAFLGPFASHGGAEAGSAAAEQEYHPPTWLMTGVWMTEASGFASVPPRAQSDFGTAADAALRRDRRSDR